MPPSGLAPVIGKDGRLGSIDPGSQPLDGSQTPVLVRLDDGRALWIPYDLLEPRPDGSYYLPINRAHLDLPPRMQPAGEMASTLILPVIAEELEVRTRQVSSGVRVTKRVHSEEQLVDEPGYVEEIDVQRVPRNQEIAEPVSARYEGETLVIPLIEEVLVVEKRLVLKEEIRIHKRRKETRNPQRITLRREEAIVERIDDGSENL
jgi:uncharacterized protein (TIGR02271 family)